MKKSAALLLVTSMVLGTLMACGNKQSASTETTAAPSVEAAETSAAEAETEAESQSETSGEKKVLEVMWFSDGGEGESFMKLADTYMSEHPDIQIELVEVPYADINTRVMNMLNGGEAPAIARLTSIGQFQNQMLDLTPYLSDPQAFIDSFSSGLKFVYDGKILAAPMDITANGLIYNKTAFEAAGVEVPESEDDIWNWEEFKEALQKVVDSGNCKYGLVYDFSPQRFTNLLYQAGGSLLNEDLTEGNYDTQEARRAISYFKDLHDSGIIPSSIWLGAEDPNNMFRSGQVAAHWAGSWMIANYQSQITDFEWGVTYLPKDARRSSIPGGKYLTAFQGSGVEKEAAEFIEWISKPENNAQYCVENGYLSQLKDNESLDYEFGADYFKIFAQEMAASSEVPGAEWGYQTFTALVQTELKESVASVLAGNISVDEHCQSMNELFNEALKELSEE